jgi:hypothetical protein
LVGSADVRKVDPRRKPPGDHCGGIGFHLWGIDAAGGGRWIGWFG